ncbi:MAG: type II toxin-antitoxin system VapC family toxin [Anaerolineales bacterium]|nr:type II toxin-antitoxin system VapC family toxin [Anaerolineales bacterium]
MSPAKPVYLLDSFALLAYLDDEAGKARVQELLALADSGKCRAMMSMINLGEVLYIVERERGLTWAQSVLALVESLPIELLEASRGLVLDAAHVKANYTLSYADAFAVAASIQEKAIILTGDPEFKAVEELVSVEWIKD